MEILEVIWDALKDSLILLPFLFLVYLLIEVIEGKGSKKLEAALSGRFAPVVGGAVGIFPQCGFSVMCSNLFRSGIITLGTLIAVFLSTSDEGLIILLGERKFLAAGLVTLIKVVYAIIIGLLINLIYKKKSDALIEEPELVPCCGEDHGHNKWEKFLWHPLFHSLMIFAFLLAVNLVFGFLFYFIGEERVVEFLSSAKFFQPVLCALIGLIPNCSASVVLAKSYSLGAITFGGLIAGLSANAGIGLAVLFKDRHKLKESFIILLLMFLLSLPIGYVCLLIRI